MLAPLPFSSFRYFRAPSLSYGQQEIIREMPRLNPMKLFRVLRRAIDARSTTGVDTPREQHRDSIFHTGPKELGLALVESRWNLETTRMKKIFLNSSEVSCMFP